MIFAKFLVDGIVEKPDVIGAIFGQTEGLFGPELDLRELQKGGRIGRIEIDLKTKGSTTEGTILIPSSLDRPLTALLAAAVESVDKIGPYACKVTLDKISDVREERRKTIMKRARDLLQKWTVETRAETEELIKAVAESIKVPEVITYGPEKLPAGPEVDKSSSIIVVEGRADVIHMMKSGYHNVVALGGARIPETIMKLSKEREVTVFLDGDRSADLIWKELLRSVDVDFVARAPRGKEVEELTPKEIAKALRERVPAKQLLRKEPQVEVVPVEVPETVASTATELKETLEAVLLNEEMKEITRIPVSELVEELQRTEGVHTIIFDGIVTGRLLDVASQKGVKRIVADRISRSVKAPPSIELLTFSDIALSRKPES
jgi:DNA primase